MAKVDQQEQTSGSPEKVHLGRARCPSMASQGEAVGDEGGERTSQLLTPLYELLTLHSRDYDFQSF